MSPECCALIHVSFTAQIRLGFYFRYRNLIWEKFEVNAPSREISTLSKTW